MTAEEEGKRFSFTYSAPTEPERLVIESIRSRYTEEEEPVAVGVSKLRALDSKARVMPRAVGISVGVFALLVFGLGFIMILKWDILVGGVCVSLAGIVIAVLTFPLYALLVNRQKEKYSGEILELSDKLLQGGSKQDKSDK